MAKKKEVAGSASDTGTAAVQSAGAVASVGLALEKQPMIMIKAISKSYKKKLVLQDVNFEIFENDIFGVVGMSGSGKTTLFELMAGINSPDSGDVLVRSDILLDDKKGSDKGDHPDYYSVFRSISSLKKKFGFASQTPSFYPHLTVGENITLYGDLYGMKKKVLKERAEELLRLVGLEDETETISSELSGGMQRRLDIACSLLHNPKVLFMDEPTSDLDPVMRRQIWTLIKRINSRGTTVVITSHILSEVESLCTKVAILHDRKMWGYGKLSELKQLFRKGLQIRIEFAPPEYGRLIKLLNKKTFSINRIAEQDAQLVLFTPRDDRNTQKILKVVQGMSEKLVKIDVSDASLTEIFEMLAKKKP
jgi:ABC-2 type transport system ATP-binding protein